jgi:hypothetical protein
LRLGNAEVGGPAVFEEQRDYHAVLLAGSAPWDRSAVRQLLASSQYTDQRALPAPYAGQAAFHGYIRSSIPYARVESTLNAITETRARAKLYRFDVYTLTYQSRASLCLLGMPFIGLLKEVVRRLIESRSRRSSFVKVDLSQLVTRVLSGQHMEGRLKLRALDFDVEGDENVTRLLFRGPDTLYSRTYSRTVEGLSGIQLSPRACTMGFDDHAGRRVSLEADRFGNFAFHIAKGVTNLPHLHLLLQYLDELGLLQEAPVDPTRRLK